MTPENKVLSLEELRARVQTRKKDGVDLSALTEFYHEGLGGKVLYGVLPSAAMHRLRDVTQYYPFDYPDPTLRGQKSSTLELDQRNYDKILLRWGVWTQDGKRIDDETAEALLDDALSGPSNKALCDLIERKCLFEGASGASLTYITAFTQWEAAFHDLLVKTGWVKHWVEYVTSSDESSAEMKEAAAKLTKLEEAAPEWARQLESEKLFAAMQAGETL
jgi:hypothetical protein